MAGRLLVGTSGWIYPHWKGVFYPAGLDADQSLAYYSKRFPTVEINYSFYKLPARENFVAWEQQTPSDFVFAVKASRFMTHMKKLREPAESIERLFDRIAGLGPKLGPILFQLPPHWGKNVSRLVDFLDHLPRDHRYAFEFRDPSWLSEDVYLALSAHGTALVISDYRSLPLVLAQTANFVYVRLHGGQHGPCYDVEDLEVWADRVRNCLVDGIDTYMYFNNDPQGCAPRDAALLTRMVEDRKVGR
jgi:uncharacterized protein YecE (DUF72 family)